jgi:hypothetical protein
VVTALSKILLSHQIHQLVRRNQQFWKRLYAHHQESDFMMGTEVVPEIFYHVMQLMAQEGLTA